MSKERTIGELLEEARKEPDAPELAGHDTMNLEHSAPNIRHMTVLDMLSHEPPVDFKGEHMRLFLTDEGYKKALASQGCNGIEIRNHARVAASHLHYGRKDRDL